MTQQDVRWKQRFENLKAAHKVLEEAIQENFHKPNHTIIQMALIKAFEMTFELSWKTMKDYLIYNGIDTNSPRDVIKQAFANNIIEDGQLWINMLEERNLMAHTYDEEKAKAAVAKICTHYMQGVEQIYLFFTKKIL